MFRYEVAQEIKEILREKTPVWDTVRLLDISYAVLNYLDSIEYPSTVEDEAYQGQYPKENI